MSQMNQLMATLAVGFVLSVGLMWTVEQDAIRGKPRHHTNVSEVQKTVTDSHSKQLPPAPFQPARI
jgi:hypothetical protein